MTVTERSDAELLSRAHDGDGAAVGELFARHRTAGLRLARSYRAADPEDLVSEAFERVIGALRRGAGPDEAFRPYLFVTIRRLAGDRAARPTETPLDELPDGLAAVSDASADELTDRQLAIQAFAALPDRLQTVLWHTAVEGRRPREVARATGVPANTVSVMASRAREHLRQSYLQAHLGGACPEACGVARARLGRYVRGTLARRHRVQVDAHLDHCAACRDLADELSDVNRTIARAVLPVFAAVDIGGGASAATTAAAGGAAGAGPTAAGGGGASAGSTAAGGGTAATGGATAGGAALAGTAGGGIGLATVAKIAAGVAVIAGLVAASPIDVLDRGDPSGTAETVDRVSSPSSDDRDAGVGRAGTTGDGDAREAGDVDTPAATGAGDASGPGGDAGNDDGDGAPSGGGTRPLDVEVGLGGGSAEAGVSVNPLPDVEVDAGVSVSPERGVELDASWRAGLLGSGTLDVDVLNPGGEALAAGKVVVDLSSGARPSSLAGTSCKASDPSLVGAVLSLLGSLTCTLGSLAAGAGTSVDLPLTVIGAGQTATVRVLDGNVVLASVVVALA